MGISQGKQDQFAQWGLLAVAGVAGVWFLTNALRNAASSDQAEQIGDINTQQAMSIYAALNDGAFGWGEDEEALYAIAKQVKDWPKVVKAYSNLYKGANVATDLTSVLSADEMAQFYKYMNMTSAATASLNEFILKYGFKYRAGQMLKSNPSRPGETRVYYSTFPTPTTNKLMAANTVVGSSIGKIVGYGVFNIQDYDGKKKQLNFYQVNSIPGQAASTRWYVPERDVLKAS
jgi:hypothetical protein